MGSLKRKVVSSGVGAVKSTRNGATEDRPSKRPKSGAKDNSKNKPEKKNNESTDTNASLPRVSLLKEEEPLFPRGGGSILTPLEYKQIQVQAKSDALFDQQKTNKSTESGEVSAAKKQRSRRKDTTEGRHKSTTTAQAEDSVKINSLNFKRLVKGSLVLGQISDITPLEVTVTLPNNLTGHLPITSISQTLTERIEEEAENEKEEDGDNEDVFLQSMFEIGQFIRVSVVSTEDDSSETKTRRRIELSTRPEHTNAGLSDQDIVRNCTVMASVASVEDRGFVMNLDIQGSDIRGFLAKKELDSSMPEERLQPGAVLLCIVASRDPHGKVAQLSTQKKLLGSTKHVLSDATTINAFLPGTIVDVLLSEVNARGLAGKILGHLDATADMIHSGGGVCDADLDEKYKVASKIKARVICTFPTADSPKVGVSLLPHILSLEPQTVGNSKKSNGNEASLKSPTEVLPLSSVVENCVVRKADLNVGLWIDVGVNGVPGFVHISRVKDGKVDALYESSGPYQIGSSHRGRVVGYNAIDGTFLVSFQQHILEQPYLRIEDIPVGQVVSGHIKRIIITENGVTGLIVEVSEGISGLVSETHFSDVKLQHPEKKFREGMKVKARVLSTDPSKHQFRLTLKKTLVNSDLPPVKSFDELSVGLQCLGTVVNVLAIGAYIQFYGDLRAFLPVGEMSEAYIEDPKEHFRQGQVVSVRVLKFDESKNKFIVSCKDPSSFGADKQLYLQALTPGTLVSGKIVQKNEDSIDLELAENGLKATLPVNHISDRSAAKNQSALKRMHVGQTLANVLVLDKHEGRHVVTVSQKPSLIAASKEGKLLTQIDNARVGTSLTGFVRHITPTAVYVQFAANIVALLPVGLLPVAMRAEQEFGLHKIDTVNVKIVSVDNSRLVVSMRELKSEAGKDVESTPMIVNPVDVSITAMDDFSVGKITTVQVTSVKDTQLNVKLADNVLGRIDISEVFDKWEDVPDAKEPLRDFKEGQVVKARILGIHDSKRRVYLPLTQQKTRSVLELSAKPSAVQEDAIFEPLTIEKVEPGSTWVAFVNNHGSNCLWLSLSPNVRGRMYGMEASDDMSLVKDLAANFPVGTAMSVRVLRVDAAKGRIDLSSRSSDGGNELAWNTVQKNMVLPGKVTKVTDRQILVQLSKTVSGPVHVIDLVDDYDQATTTAYFKNDIIRVAVVAVDGGKERIRLSTRPSRVLNSSLPVEDREIASVADVKAGETVRGFVRSIADKGLFVNLGGDVVGMVRITDLSDNFLKDWKAHFCIDQLVKARVVSVNTELKQVQLSLKASVVDEDYVPRATLADFKEGQIVSGRVRKVEEFGAFIVIDNSANVSGLCHRSEMSDNAVRNATKLYKEGDIVKAKILSINHGNGRVNLGLKPAYFTGSGDDDDDDDAMSLDNENAGAPLQSEDDNEYDDDESDEEMEDASGGLLISGTDNVDDEDSEEKDASGTKTSLDGLSGGGFDWSGGALGQDMEDPSDHANGEAAQKPKSAKRKKAKVDVDRTAELDVSGPQTASDFERLLLSQPDSSALWIAYMAFQLQVSELAKARDVAERAIKTINVREETERLNVWVAYLNLEVVYGTDDTAEEVFKRACQYNDDREVFGRAVSIYIQSGKHEKAGELFEGMIKKFGAQTPQVWVNYGHFLYNTLGDDERGRLLMKRAVQTVDVHAQPSLMARFAALEFRSSKGLPERGRTLFENILSEFGKRFDLWNQLLDLETALFDAEKTKPSGGDANAEVVRGVFKRAVKAKGIKARQAKTLFQRWAKWEEKHGDAKSRKEVSAAAKEWTNEVEKKKKKARDEEQDGDSD